jgi:hypothetical protein
MTTKQHKSGWQQQQQQQQHTPESVKSGKSCSKGGGTASAFSNGPKQGFSSTISFNSVAYMTQHVVGFKQTYSFTSPPEQRVPAAAAPAYTPESFISSRTATFTTLSEDTK